MCTAHKMKTPQKITLRSLLVTNEKLKNVFTENL